MTAQARRTVLAALTPREPHPRLQLFVLLVCARCRGYRGAARTGHRLLDCDCQNRASDDV